MSSGKAFPPKMWASLEDWERVYQSCDLGDGYSLSIYAHPHLTEQVPHMIKLMDVEEHSALLQEKDKEIERLRAALEWYADGLYPGDESMVGNKLMNGRRAREALAGGKDD